MKMNPEQKKSFLLQTFDALKSNYHSNWLELKDIIEEIAKLNLSQSIELWKYLINENRDVLHSSDGDQLAFHIMYPIGEVVGKTKIYQVVVEDDFLRNSIYGECGNLYFTPLDCIGHYIQIEDFATVELLVELIFSNKYNTRSLYSIIDDIIPSNGKLSDKGIHLINGWIEMIDDPEKKAKLNLKMLKFYENDQNDEDSNIEQHTRSILPQKRSTLIDDGVIYKPDIKLSVRSIWEANVARILNYLGVPYEYESLCLTRYNTAENASPENRNGVYIPDFILPGNKIIEVKGRWNSDSRQKALEFTKHFVNYQYYIIDIDFYYSLTVRYADAIPEWEGQKWEKSPLGSKEHAQVVGITYGDRPKTIKTLSVNQELVLECDPQNKFDKNAVLVKTLEGEEVGFLSADWACIYAPKLNLGMTFSVTVESIEAKKVCVFIARSNPEEFVLWDIFR